MVDRTALTSILIYTNPTAPASQWLWDRGFTLSIAFEERERERKERVSRPFVSESRNFFGLAPGPSVGRPRP